MEFFLLKPGEDGALIPPAPHDDAGYFDAPSEAVAELGRQMISTLATIGIDVEAMHHEVAGGQHEIDFRDAGAAATADNIVTFRVALKAIAKLNGFYGTFMPKPIAGMSGSGMHVHQGMRYAANGRDAFHDSGDPHGLSSLAKHFIAGQLAHARGACADTRAARQFLQAAVRGLRGARPHQLGEDQSRGPHPGAEGDRDRAIPEGRAALPRPELQSLPRLRRHALRGPGRHPPRAAPGRGERGESLRLAASGQDLERNAPYFAQRGDRRPRGRRGRVRDPRALHREAFHRGEAARVGGVAQGSHALGAREVPRQLLSFPARLRRALRRPIPISAAR